MYKICSERKKDDMEMRKIYSTTLLELMKKDERIVALEADLMGSMSTDIIQKELPGRIINGGIMEGHIAGMAGGMSIAGKVPFFHTFTAFASRRCFDQLFMSNSY